MRVAVVGPGAVGATFGAAAERAGHDVVLCGRRAAPAPVVECPDGTEHALREPVRADPGEAPGGPVPWVLLAVETYQTAGASDWLRALCDTGTTVAVLQNGVENRALVAPHAGPARVRPAIRSPAAGRRSSAPTASGRDAARPGHLDPVRPPRWPADGVGRAQRRRAACGRPPRRADAGERRARAAARGAGRRPGLTGSRGACGSYPGT